MKTGPTLGEVWQGKKSTVPLGEVGFGYRPTLSDSSSRQDLEDEIEWIHDTLIDVLNSHTKVVTICARSKRWWSDEIREKRRTLGRATRKRRAGRGGEAEVKVAKKELRREIRRSRRECWERFLNEANGEDV